MAQPAERATAFTVIYGKPPAATAESFGLVLGSAGLPRLYANAHHRGLAWISSPNGFLRKPTFRSCSAASTMKSRLVWLVLCLIWGSTWLFIKLGLSDLPPFTFAGIRFVIACAILFAIVAVRRLPLPRTRADWLLLATTGVLSFSLNYGLLFWGEQYISSGLAALLQATIPAFGLVIAHFYLPDEQMTPIKIFGVGMGVAGVGVIFSNQLSVAGPRALAGCAALVVGSACAAYANVLVKARGANLNPAILAGGQMFFGLIPLLLIGIPLEGNPFHFHWTRMAVISVLSRHRRFGYCLSALLLAGSAHGRD